MRDNTAPRVRILGPENNTTYSAPATIAISLRAVDRDDNLTNAELFANGSSLAVFTGPLPYEFSWTNVTPGTYALTAIATDDLGLTTTSRTVTVTVTGVQPPAEKKIYFIHVDHLNTPRMIADEQQRTVWRWDQTEPFGDSVPDENPSGLGAFEFPMRFPGQYFDRETSLHYNYFRDFDPTLGRYVQSDPIGLRGGLNTFSYVFGDPLVLVDLEGLKAVICCRTLSGPVGAVLRQRHCYFNVDGTTYGLYPEGNAGFPRINDKRDRGGLCKECKPLSCSYVNSCIRDQHDFYPLGDYDAVYGPNSNTYAGTLARACCAGGFPAGMGDAPGLIDALPSHNPRLTPPRN